MDEGKTIIVGFGEIGKAVKEAICPDAVVYDISMTEHPEATTPTEVMHICFPYSDDFVHTVRAYITIWQPKHVAIWSTLPIGTTKQVSDKVVHSFVEGRHPRLASSVRLMPRWIGYNDESEGSFFTTYFQKRGLEIRLINNTDHTEALKLLSTTEYGHSLIYADYKKRVADAIGMDFELTKLLNHDYNKLYRDLDMPQFQKFILDPPEGKIGGHCIRENSILLNAQYPDTLLDRINAMKKPEGEKQ